MLDGNPRSDLLTPPLSGTVLPAPQPFPLHCPSAMQWLRGSPTAAERAPTLAAAAASDDSDTHSRSTRTGSSRHSSSTSSSSRHDRRGRGSPPLNPESSTAVGGMPAVSSSRAPMLISGPYSPMLPLVDASVAAADPFAAASAASASAARPSTDESINRGSGSDHSSRASSTSSSRSSSSSQHPHPHPRKHRESRGTGAHIAGANTATDGSSTVRIDVAPHRSSTAASASSSRRSTAPSTVRSLPRLQLLRERLWFLLPRGACLARVPSLLPRRTWMLFGLILLAAAAAFIHSRQLPPEVAPRASGEHAAASAKDTQPQQTGAQNRVDGSPAAGAASSTSSDVDPWAFVRQWHLAPLGPLHHPIPSAAPSASPSSPRSMALVSGLSVDPAGPPPLRWAPPDVPLVSGPVHPTCGTPSNKTCVREVPSAHRAGLGSYPSLSLPFTFAELRDALGDEPHFDLWFEVVPPPWLLRLTTHAVRYEPDEGAFLLLLSFDDAYSHINAVRGLEEDACMGRSTAVRSRRLKLFLAMQGSITCGYSGTGSNAEPRVALLRSRGEVLELRCPWPNHPELPPSELFYMDVSYGLASAAAGTDVPPLSMRVPIQSSLSRRVQFALCVRTLTDPLALHALPDFLQHHAFMGVEVFHVYDRYAQPAVRALLQPYMQSGLVELHDAPEHTYAYQRGKPSDFSTFSHQAHAQEMCRYRTVQSARYIAMWDTDEYLYFPQRVEPENTTIDYDIPNGIPVQMDDDALDKMTVPMELPSCMEKQWATGRLQPSYRELDRANAEADARLGQLPSQVSSAQRSSIDVRSLWSDSPAPLSRAVHCTSMLSTLLARTFTLAQPVLPADRLCTDPWFISLNLHVHVQEWSQYSVAREEWMQSLPLRSLRPHSTQLKYRPGDLAPPVSRLSTGSVQRVEEWRVEDRRRRQLESGDVDEESASEGDVLQCGLPAHESFRARWTTSRNTAATVGAIVAQANAAAALAAPSAPSSLPPSLPPVASCFALENFHYPLLLRYPWRSLGFPINNPKFLLSPSVDAALKVHSASNATGLVGAKRWSILLRNRHRTKHDRKTEPPVATVHAPPIAVLLHFRNAHTSRHQEESVDEDNNSYPQSPSVQFYLQLTEAIERMPCSRIGSGSSRSTPP